MLHKIKTNCVVSSKSIAQFKCSTTCLLLLDYECQALSHSEVKLEFAFLVPSGAAMFLTFFCLNQFRWRFSWDRAKKVLNPKTTHYKHNANHQSIKQSLSLVHHNISSGLNRDVMSILQYKMKNWKASSCSVLRPKMIISCNGRLCRNDFCN